jgi:Rrf2 family protein
MIKSLHPLIQPRIINAIKAVRFIAQQDDLVSAAKISDHLGLLPRYFETTLKQLAAARIIYGYRGPNGGYRLVKSASQITFRDVVSAISSYSDNVEDPLMLVVQAALDNALADLKLDIEIGDA